MCVGSFIKVRGSPYLDVLQLAQAGAVGALPVGQHPLALAGKALRGHVVLVRSGLVALQSPHMLTPHTPELPMLWVELPLSPPVSHPGSRHVGASSRV